MIPELNSMYSRPHALAKYLHIVYICREVLTLQLHYNFFISQDRFAAGRFEPSIDASQDWTLVGHEEREGRTIMEFTRDMNTCDENDIVLSVKTTTAILTSVKHYSSSCKSTTFGESA